MPRQERDRLARPGAGWVRTLLGTTILLLSACGASTTSVGCCYGCGDAPPNYQYWLQVTNPAVADGVVIIGTTASTANGAPADSPLVRRSYDVITSLRASDGSVLWQRPDPLYGVDNLSADRGTLIVSTWNQLTAMRPSDGTVLRQTTRGSWVPPVFDQDVIYTSDSQGLYAIRLSDGQLLWQLPPLAATPSSGTGAYLRPTGAYLRPVVSGGVVYAGSLNTLVAVRATDGTILWQTSVAPSAATPTPNPTGRNHTSVPGPAPIPLQPVAVARGQLVVSADDKDILLVRTNDGHVDGQIPSQAQTHTVVPVLIDGTPYLAVTNVAPNQATFSLQTSDQKLLWQVRLGAPGAAIVAAEDGVIYLDSGSLLAIRLTDGTVLWHAPIPEGLIASDAGHLYFTQSTGYIDICASSHTQLGTVTQLSKKDGSISWVTHIPAAR